MLPSFRKPVSTGLMELLMDVSHLLLILPQTNLVLQLVRQSIMGRARTLVLVDVALATALLANQPSLSYTRLYSF